MAYLYVPPLDLEPLFELFESYVVLINGITLNFCSLREERVLAISLSSTHSSTRTAWVSD